MSTGRNSTINQALGIALIVFVMLTFVLTVTTYLFFGQKYLAEKKEQEARKEAEQKTTESLAATEKEKELREILGFEEAKTIDEMREEFAKLFPDYEGDAKAFLPLSRWLKDVVKEKDAALAKAQQAQVAAEADMQKAQNALKAAEDAFTAKVKEVEVKLQGVEKQSADSRSEFEQVEKSLVSEKEAALQKIEAMKLIVDAIDKGRDLVNKPDKFEALSPAERVTALQDTIRDRNKTIQLLERTEFLQAVAATNPQVQMFVLEALRSEASGIDPLRKLLDKLAASEPAEAGTRIDGRVVDVDQREQTVTITCDSTFGIRPGLVFNVHPGTLPAGTVLPVKAVVEVVAVDGNSLVRGRIRRDAIEDPIIAGDPVSTPLWSPGKNLEVVIVGWVDFDGDGRFEDKNQGDYAMLADMVRRAGGTVARNVSSSTTVVVDAGNGPAPGEVAKGGLLKQGEQKRLDEQRKKAKELGVRILDLDQFLAWIGQERPRVATESVLVPGSDRLPQSRGSRSD